MELQVSFYSLFFFNMFIVLLVGFIEKSHLFFFNFFSDLILIYRYIYFCFFQLNPGDSVMDIRQFLLDAPETCYYTCYELLLRNKDGETHHLEDYNEISEVADITVGGCSLEMVAGIYTKSVFP